MDLPFLLVIVGYYFLLLIMIVVEKSRPGDIPINHWVWTELKIYHYRWSRRRGLAVEKEVQAESLEAVVRSPRSHGIMVDVV